MADDPSQKPPAISSSDPKAAPDTEAGQLAEDDRGNMTWEWANNEELQADDTAGRIERLRALVDPRLDIMEVDAPGSLRDNYTGLKTGYNPYDSGSLGRTARRKKIDLRELSKWIETQRKVEGNVDPVEKKDEPGE